MKYFLSLIQFIICGLISVLIVGLILFYSFRVSFTRENVIRHLINDKNISALKDKIQSDLISVSNANGLEPAIFDGFVTNEMVINNNRDYINGVLDFIYNPSLGLPTTTKAAEDFENGIKQILYDYGKKTDPDKYIITDKGVAAFATLEKLTFFKSAVPIIGFETLSGYMQKMYRFSFRIYSYATLSIIILFGFLLLLGKNKWHLSFAFLLYSFCSAGILTFFISKLANWFIASNNTILNSSYLAEVIRGFFSKGSFFGAVFIIGSQIFLIAFFLIKKRFSKPKS
jgi:hypothetical protein